MIPALRTRKSMPDGAISFATRAARYTDFSSSNSIATHVPDPIVFVVFAHLSKVRAVVMTVHPASAKPRATAKPRPEDAPVTTAVLFSSEGMRA